jgi:APA family basic amino acid/polyamine antiporter
MVPLTKQLRLPSSDAQALPARAFAVAFGPGADAWLLALLALSVLGSANPGLLSSPRAFYAMAQDGLLPRALVAVHPKSGTPVVAILVQAATAALQVVVLQSFRDLTEFVVFASFLGYALTVAGVVRLRRTRPLAARPYRCAGYPWTPLLFVATALAFVVGLLADPVQRTNACYGLIILATGLPAYAWITRRRKR